MTSKQSEPARAKKTGGGLRGPDRDQDSLQDREGGTFDGKTPERLQREDDPDKTIKEAVKDAQHTLTEYIHPGNRNCDETVNKLITTLGNNEVAEAILESDAQEPTNVGRSEEKNTSRRKPH
jgi:hypothetical protein